jgi:hypothetical protein
MRQTPAAETFSAAVFGSRALCRSERETVVEADAHEPRQRPNSRAARKLCA